MVNLIMFYLNVVMFLIYLMTSRSLLHRHFKEYNITIYHEPKTNCLNTYMQLQIYYFCHYGLIQIYSITVTSV